MFNKITQYNFKNHKIRIIRAVLQLLFLFLLPGFFALVFSEIRNTYISIIKGNLNFVQIYPSLIELITIFILTVILGRFFCSFICAFGTLNDLIHAVGKNIFKINFKLDKKIDYFLKYIKYIVLIALIIFSWTMGSNIFKNADPWDAFARLISFQQITGNLILEFVILIIIAMGAIFIERFFCRYLCPLGAVLKLISKISPFKIKKPNEKCGNCRLCTNNCSMGLSLYKYNSVHNGECINCLKCIEICPRRNVKTNIFNKDINSTLASSVAIASFAVIYSTNNYVGAAVNKNNLAIEASANIVQSKKASNKIKYKDGVYTGNSSMYIKPNVQVSVTIKQGEIVDIKAEQTEGTPGYYEKVVNIIPNEIIKAQSTQVDVVSGASSSSQGIIVGAQEALEKAKVK